MAGWISVKDKLPDVLLGVMRTYLITDGLSVTVGLYYIKSIDGWSKDRKYAWRAPLSDCSEAELWDTITHWMPMPDPPKEGK